MSVEDIEETIPEEPVDTETNPEEPVVPSVIEKPPFYFLENDEGKMLLEFDALGGLKAWDADAFMVFSGGSNDPNIMALRILYLQGIAQGHRSL